MRVLDILNLKPRKLNHHDEVYQRGQSPKLQVVNNYWAALEGQPLEATVLAKS